MEYAAVIVLVAAVAAALFMVGLPRIVSDGVSDVVGDVLGPDESATGDTSGTESGELDGGPPAPGEADLDEGAEALPPLDDAESYEARPLLYQPGSGKGCPRPLGRTALQLNRSVTKAEVFEATTGTRPSSTTAARLEANRMRMLRTRN